MARRHYSRYPTRSAVPPRGCCLEEGARWEGPPSSTDVLSNLGQPLSTGWCARIRVSEKRKHRMTHVKGESHRAQRRAKNRARRQHHRPIAPQSMPSVSGHCNGGVLTHPVHIMCRMGAKDTAVTPSRRVEVRATTAGPCCWLRLPERGQGAFTGHWLVGDCNKCPWLVMMGPPQAGLHIRIHSPQINYSMQNGNNSEIYRYSNFEYGFKRLHRRYLWYYYEKNLKTP